MVIVDKQQAHFFPLIFLFVFHIGAQKRPKKQSEVQKIELKFVAKIQWTDRKKYIHIFLNYIVPKNMFSQSTEKEQDLKPWTRNISYIKFLGLCLFSLI